MTSRDAVSRIKADGWFEVRQRGSHLHFRHPTKPGRVTVPHPTSNLPIGTLRSIEKQSGVSMR